MCGEMRNFLQILCETEGDLIPAKLVKPQITKPPIKCCFLDRGDLDKQFDV